MEERKSMQFFIEDCSYVSEPELDTFYIELGDMCMVGKELRIEDRKITYYILPFQDKTALVIMYLTDDEPFDSFISNIDDYNIEGASNAWPSMIQSLKNGADDNYYKPALIKINDLFWGMTVSIENVELEDLDSEYIINKVGSLCSYTIDMLQEIADNDISTWDKVKGCGKAAHDGYKIGKIASAIIGIGGALLGIPGLDSLGGDA